MTTELHASAMKRKPEDDAVFIPHSYALLNTADRVACLVIDGVGVNDKARENLVCAREIIDRILDGRLAEGSDHMALMADLSRIGRNEAG